MAIMRAIPRLSMSDAKILGMNLEQWKKLERDCFPGEELVMNAYKKTESLETDREDLFKDFSRLVKRRAKAKLGKSLTQVELGVLWNYYVSKQVILGLPKSLAIHIMSKLRGKLLELRKETGLEVMPLWRERESELNRLMRRVVKQAGFDPEKINKDQYYLLAEQTVRQRMLF